MQNIIKDVVNQMVLPYQFKLFTGEKKELNLLSNWKNHLIFIFRPLNFDPSLIAGERKYVYNNLQLFFGKVTPLQTNTETLNEHFKECKYNYEQFIKLLRQQEFIRVKSESITEIFNDMDMNLAGLAVTLNVEYTITEIKC